MKLCELNIWIIYIVSLTLLVENRFKDYTPIFKTIFCTIYRYSYISHSLTKMLSIPLCLSGDFTFLAYEYLENVSTAYTIYTI